MNALQGVKILDFTPVESGPTATRLLAWFGANLIKSGCRGVEYAPGTNNHTMYK
jgi:formyl-CoA transferase